MNHGCNGTKNFGSDPNFMNNPDSTITEMNFDPSLSSSSDDFVSTAPVYSPVHERHLLQVQKFGDVTLRSITKGEEIVTDYMEFGGDEEGLLEDALKLRGWCSGELVGEITQYEDASST
jgi:hypothetical protein